MNKYVIVEISAAAVIVAMCIDFLACSSPQSRSTAAEMTYAAEQLKCVDDSATRAEADACRANVRVRWGVDGGAR